MAFGVDNLLRTAATLEQALLAIGRTPTDDAVMFDPFRNAAIKSFESSLETAGRLLRKALEAFGVLHDGALPTEAARPRREHGCRACRGRMSI